ncbi:MAG: hypothetical protein BWY93_00729 [Euryarchaeota archaeon ADurb.BinA087]|nr:MAG: hypothetical protein BWY93_00729 [Euryarchaeota archaeon ADurb.BinA087]
MPHTTAGLTINENADPDVARDILTGLARLVPVTGNHRHAEGNSDAHIKASLMGFSLRVPVIEGRLALGTWRGISFCEFDGARHRQVLVGITGGLSLPSSEPFRWGMRSQGGVGIREPPPHNGFSG